MMDHVDVLNSHLLFAFFRTHNNGLYYVTILRFVAGNWHNALSRIITMESTQHVLYVFSITIDKGVLIVCQQWKVYQYLQTTVHRLSQFKWPRRADVALCDRLTCCHRAATIELIGLADTHTQYPRFNPRKLDHIFVSYDFISLPLRNRFVFVHFREI